jgi:hypothetical protein
MDNLTAEVGSRHTIDTGSILGNRSVHKGEDITEARGMFSGDLKVIVPAPMRERWRLDYVATPKCPPDNTAGAAKS